MTADLLASVLGASTVLALAGLGLLINEKAGVSNLGAEGLLLCSALAGYAACVHTHSQWWGFLAGMVVSALLAAMLGFLVIWLNTNQTATGLALALLGAGLSAFLGVPYTQHTLPAAYGSFAVPVLSQLPFVGRVFFTQHPMTYFSVLFALFLTWFLNRSRAGLVLRSVGESPESAHGLGYKVRLIRLAATVAGGAICGLAGAYLTLVYTPNWTEGMVAGKGWIALALIPFATWRPLYVLLGAWLFGGVTILQLWLQTQGIGIASQWLTMLPYLSIIVVLVLISRNPLWIRVNKPTALGKPFYPGR